MSRYEVVLELRVGGPCVSGFWNADGPARRTYRAWVGRYGSGSAVVRLIEESANGQRQVLKSCPPLDPDADRE